MYFDEDLVLDIRLNTLNEFVDYFIIVESTFTHRGDKRKLRFDLKKYEKFRNKIIYLIYDNEPNGIQKINDEDTESVKSEKYIFNAILRENGQRNHILNGLLDAEKNDVILVSDVDEIPNLTNVDFSKIRNKIFIFRQEMFYYKLNLKLPNLIWSGTKGCRKKDLINPQWLRNIKDKNYSKFRLDTFFSKKKYSNIKFFNKGGWHFTNIKTAKEIQLKLKSYLHHREFDINPMSLEQIENVINDKKAIYDLKADQRVNKIGDGDKLIKYELRDLPIYIKENIEKFSSWID
tara:strand:- start:410 stop:1279 length:870 start_codon:yes stop_codon:yes gene_type:complete